MTIDPRLRHFYRTFYRVPFLVPGWGPEELAVVRAAVLTGRPWPSEPQRDLQRLLADRFGFSHTVLTASGRYALEVGLRSLERAPDGEVILPTLCCEAIVDAVRRASLRPVFADIGADLTISCASVMERTTPRTVAVVVAHLSGKPAADFEAILAWCRPRGIAVVDDAAQALGVMWRGRPLGVWGDLGLLSFGLGKPTFSLGGGALVVSSEAQAVRCESLVRSLAEPMPSRAGDAAHACVFLFAYQCRRYTAPLMLAIGAMRKATRRPPPRLRRGPMSNLEAALQIVRIRKLEASAQRVKDNAGCLVNRLERLPGLSIPQQGPECGYSKFIVSVKDGTPEGLAAHLLRRGIEVEWSYRPLHLRGGDRQAGGAPVAERLSATLLTLPTHAGLGVCEIEYVGSAVADYFRGSNANG